MRKRKMRRSSRAVVVDVASVVYLLAIQLSWISSLSFCRSIGHVAKLSFAFCATNRAELEKKTLAVCGGFLIRPGGIGRTRGVL